MRGKSTVGAGAVILVTVAALTTACGSGNDHGAGSDKAATAAGTTASAGGSADGAVSFGTVFGDKAKMKLALPDPASMHGWTPSREALPRGDSKEPKECGPDSDWECAGVATARKQYQGGGEDVNFDIVAFADQKAAQDACRKEGASSAKYDKVDVPSLGAFPNHAYYREAGGLNGANLTMCLGTVVATTTLEGGSMDPATLRTLAQIFATRIQKAATATTS